MIANYDPTCLGRTNAYERGYEDGICDAIEFKRVAH